MGRAGVLQWVLDAKVWSFCEASCMTPAHFYRRVAAKRRGSSKEKLKTFLVFSRLYRMIHEDCVDWDAATLRLDADVEFWDRLAAIEKWEPMLRAVEAVSGMRKVLVGEDFVAAKEFLYEFSAPVRPDALEVFETKVVLPPSAVSRCGASRFITFYKKNSVPPVPRQIEALWAL
jgi:hypothetical protein